MRSRGSPSLRVQEAQSGSDMRQFVRLPWQLYDGVSTWVPPLYGDAKNWANPRKNPFLREAAVGHFIARENGKCVGRVSATVHPAYIERNGPCGFFGHFESVESPAVARALLGRAEEWSRSRGMSAIAGPYSYTSSQDVGLLVSGFDSPAAFLQPYNFPYYEGLLLESSYGRQFAAKTYMADRATHQDRYPSICRYTQRIMRAGRIRIRSADMGRYDEELELLRTLYNASFTHHQESAPISQQTFSFQAGGLRYLITADLVRFVELDGEPVAFVILVPNINEFLIGRSGRLTPALLLQWKRLLRRVESLVILVLGAIPAVHGTGVAQCLVGAMADSIATGQYRRLYSTWIHDDNAESRGLVSFLQMRENKTYAIFRKAL